MDRDGLMTAIGLMAGTSLDGVDAALLKTDGDTRLLRGPFVTIPYPAATRATIIRATKAALEGRTEAQDILDANHAVNLAHIDAVERLLELVEIDRGEVDVIGYHGQTILHRPPVDRAAPGRTWQIGTGGTLASECRIDTVDQFRLADMASGGQGAPLAPIYHRALSHDSSVRGPAAVLNLGGVANITFIPESGKPTDLVSFDCGPGNGLIDEWVHRHTGQDMDADGALAASGTADEEAVKLMALNPFVRRKPPKSLDRYDFKLGAVEKMGVADGAATLTAFTAECVARSIPLLPAVPKEWIVCGGGRRNPVLMAELAARIEAPVRSAEEKGWRGDMIEAECFAYLAVRSLKKMPLSYPKTTGVPAPTRGGQFHRKPFGA